MCDCATVRPVPCRQAGHGLTAILGCTSTDRYETVKAAEGFFTEEVPRWVCVVVDEVCREDHNSSHGPPVAQYRLSVGLE